MTRITRTALVAAAVAALTIVPVRGQERLGTGMPEPSYRAGWTITPTFGFAETYDDNVSLFGVRTAESLNNDYISTWFPAADLHFEGKHTQFGIGYTGSFLQYQTFTALNRWDQRARAEVRRQESAHLKWFLHANGALVPSTDLVEFGGIPFSRTGARTADGRGGVTYIFNPRDSLTTTIGYESIDFDRSVVIDSFLRGGNIFDAGGEYRHRLNSRLAFGGDYMLRRATVFGGFDPFMLHTFAAAGDYTLSDTWSVSGALGAVHLDANGQVAARTGPAWRGSIERHREGRTFHISYARSYIPSFGFGGTIQNQEAALGLRFPLSRRLYTDHSIVYRDDQPLTDIFVQLPLRSLRTYSTIGWNPEPWVRLEAFYSRVQQSSLRFGGQLYRNRVGFQIVTSKPVRIH